MNLKAEDIQKYDKIVREKYPMVRMIKRGNHLTFWDGYHIVATLEIIAEKLVFKFEKD